MYAVSRPAVKIFTSKFYFIFHSSAAVLAAHAAILIGYTSEIIVNFYRLLLRSM